MIKITSLKILGMKIHGDKTSNTATVLLIPSGDIMETVYSRKAVTGNWQKAYRREPFYKFLKWKGVRCQVSVTQNIGK